METITRRALLTSLVVAPVAAVAGRAQDQAPLNPDDLRAAFDPDAIDRQLLAIYWGASPVGVQFLTLAQPTETA